MAEKPETTRFDPAEYIVSEEGEIAYLKALFEDEEFDADIFLAALGDIARARSMAKIAEATGLGRESLYKALQPGSKVRFETIQKVLQALGLKLTVEAIGPGKSAAE
ncbi:addiction module antidote protein [Gellertiella hungarica]|uniref:Putative addiction module antidote protein n=1 Tax=Gellertiella hungarica TaxID=1572859 RepID=A0A7W6J1G0_9HYPH|nr:addiction module antidote protein [Gellertiella hungarica]MBB4063041.1 putative addiction module antidote protein [Gellertiella hungarica]